MNVFIHEDPSFDTLKTCLPPRWEWGTTLASIELTTTTKVSQLQKCRKKYFSKTKKLTTNEHFSNGLIKTKNGCNSLKIHWCKMTTFNLYTLHDGLLALECCSCQKRCRNFFSRKCVFFWLLTANFYFELKLYTAIFLNGVKIIRDLKKTPEGRSKTGLTTYTPTRNDNFNSLILCIC